VTRWSAACRFADSAQLDRARLRGDERRGGRDPRPAASESYGKLQRELRHTFAPAARDEQRAALRAEASVWKAIHKAARASPPRASEAATEVAPKRFSASAAYKRTMIGPDHRVTLVALGCAASATADRARGEDRSALFDFSVQATMERTAFSPFKPRDFGAGGT
jgi:hypothetical protein